LNGNARFEHRGLIAIAPEAVGSVAYQHTKNIMLSPHARAWASPSLQVLTHDVHCAHGSATGYLDEDHIYYMQARGIDLQRAKTLLLKGFFADILQEIGDLAIENKINKKIVTCIE
jgi:Fe-S cluster assembly protein SufD